MQLIQNGSELQKLNLLGNQLKTDLLLIEDQLSQMKKMISLRWNRILTGKNLIEIQELNIILMLFEEHISKIKVRINEHLTLIDSLMNLKNETVIFPISDDFNLIREELDKLVKSVIKMKNSYTRLISKLVL